MNGTLRKSVAILISGRGSNMKALLAAAAEPDYPAHVCLVISDRADAAGLEAAQKAGVPVRAIVRNDFADKLAHEAAINSALEEAGAEIVCLAGFMRLLSPAFVARWQGRLLNIHPSILPSFPGLDTHRRALEAGVLIHGCSVHFVTDVLDNGPIIAQAAVPVSGDDTEASLAARVLKAEHRLYPLALRMVAEGVARMDGARTVFTQGHAADQRLESLIVPAAARAEQNLEDLARLTP